MSVFLVLLTDTARCFCVANRHGAMSAIEDVCDEAEREEAGQQEQINKMLEATERKAAERQRRDRAVWMPMRSSD